MEELEKMKEAALAGGKILRNYFRQTLEVTRKTVPSDLVSKADLESEQVILSVLKKSFPNYNYVAEESGKAENNSAYTFYIDPLDGTYNFLTGIAYFGIVIALMKEEKLIAAVTYQPILEEMFSAGLGQGSHLNDQRIRVNNVSDITRASVGYTHSYKLHTDQQLQDFGAMRSLSVKRVLISWSLAMDFCLLARGKIEAIVNRGCEPWDYLAGKLIVKEAGAQIYDFDGNLETGEGADHFIVANNKNILEPLLKVLKK